MHMPPVRGTGSGYRLNAIELYPGCRFFSARHDQRVWESFASYFAAVTAAAPAPAAASAPVPASNTACGATEAQTAGGGNSARQAVAAAAAAVAV